MQTGYKLVKSKSGLRIICISNESSSPLYINEPIWISDKEALNCSSCEVKFDFFQRRHHCRRCGKCFCSSCCGTKYQLARMSFIDPVLQCLSCSIISRSEQIFFEEQLNVLLKGAQIKISSLNLGLDSPTNFFSKLSIDKTVLLFESDEQNPFHLLDPIPLSHINKFQLLSDSNSLLMKGIEISFVSNKTNQICCQFLICEKNKSSSSQFLNILHKALKFVLQSCSQ